MQKLILIAVLFCASVTFAQTPFDSFDTSMKSVPLFKSDKPQMFRLYITDNASPYKFIILNVETKQLDYYTKDSILYVSALIKKNGVKFLSVDPLSKKYPELTPYQFASNSPISGVDLDGLEYYFAADGSYLGQSKNGGTQIRTATAFKILKNGTTSISNWQELKQHSPTDTYKGRNEAGSPLTGLTHVSNNDMGRMIAYMNVVLEKEGSGLYQAEDAVMKQSVGIKKGSGMAKAFGDNNNYGLLDFKHSAYPILGLDQNSNNLIEYNGTVYNSNEFGNLTWGAGIAALGVTIDPVALAEAGTKWAQKSLSATDEPHDKNAIIKGAQIGTSVRAAVLGNKKALGEKDAVEIMNGANQSYNSGQATKDYQLEKNVQKNNKQ